MNTVASVLCAVGVVSCLVATFLITGKVNEINANMAELKSQQVKFSSEVQFMQHRRTRELKLEETIKTLEEKIATIEINSEKYERHLQNETDTDQSSSELRKKRRCISDNGKRLDITNCDIFVNNGNMFIRNGKGATNRKNGKGNLIIGYNENAGIGRPIRNGSHNLVVGQGHQWSTHSGIVAGFKNKILGEHGSVVGGTMNEAKGNNAAVLGGTKNRATGSSSTVSGGFNNLAQGLHSSISGGEQNKATMTYTSISGGQFNTAGATGGSILGGQDNVVIGDYACISGGSVNEASKKASSISGGRNNRASGEFSSVLGGNRKQVSGTDKYFPS